MELCPLRSGTSNRVVGVSVEEGVWLLLPLPEDQALKALVPFLGNALGCHIRVH